MSEKVETMIAMRSSEQASLSPGAYQVLTSAIGQEAAAQAEKAHHFASPLGALRWKLRAGAGDMNLTSAREVRIAVAAVLAAPEWEQAATEASTLRTQLAHWKVFGEHAESERSRLQGEVMRLSHELARLRHD